MASPIDAILEEYLKKKGISNKSKQELKVDINQEKSEHDIFHDKVLNASDRRIVADAHNVSKEEIDAARAQRQAAEAEQRAAEREAQAETAQKSAARSQAAAEKQQQRTAQYESKIKGEQQNLRATKEKLQSSGKIKIFIAFLIAIAYDIFNVFENIGAVATFGASEIVEAGIGDTTMQLVMAFLLGPYYKAITTEDLPIIGSFLRTNMPATLLEYIPFLDFIPIYTIVTWKALKNYREGASEINEIKSRIQSSKKTLKGDSKIKILFNNVKGSKVGKVMLVFFVILFITGIFFLMSSERAAASIGNAVKNAITWWQEGGIWKVFNKLFGTIQSMGEKLKNLWQQQYIAATTGQTFAGEVDQYATKALGLKIEIDKPDYYFDKDSNIFMSAVLSGRALNPNICEIIGETCDVGNIELKCSTNKNEIGVMTPSSEKFELLEDSFTPLTCEFPPGTENAIRLTSSELKDNKAERVVYMRADFDFITAGYSKKEFVSESKFIELKNSGYVFDSLTPQYTPGPVSIQFLESFIDQNPVLVSANRPVKMGIRLENTGNGIINHFKKISFIMPEGVEVRACNAPFTGSGNRKELVYEDTEDNFLRDARNGNLATGKRITLTCDLNLEDSNILDLNNDITTDFFQVIATYEYETVKSQRIDIQQQEIIDWLYDEDEICTTTQCECRPSGNIIKKGTNCRGESQSEIDSECQQITEESTCTNDKNLIKCRWVTDKCRAKTIGVS